MRGTGSVKAALLTVVFMAGATQAEEQANGMKEITDAKELDESNSSGNKNSSEADSSSETSSNTGTTNKTRERQFHLVVGGGLSSDSSDFTSEMIDIFAGTGASFEKEDIGVGHRIHVAVEAGDHVILRGGKRTLSDQRSLITYDTTFRADGHAEHEVDGNFVALDLMYPINPSVFAGVTLGQFNWDSTITFEGPNGSTATAKDDGRDNFAGLRGQALLGDEARWAVTAALESHDIEPDGSVSYEYTGFGFGAERRF